MLEKLFILLPNHSLAKKKNLLSHAISDILVSLQIHLFDIDIPGKITFMESKTLTAGETPTVVDTGLIYSFISHLSTLMSVFVFANTFAIM